VAEGKVHLHKCAGHHSSLSRAEPAIRLFHTVELCRNPLAVYPSSAMHIYGLLDVGPVGCAVPEVPVLIFNSTPNYRAGSELVGSTLLSSLLIGHM
jgi:hypothetical protein